MIVNNSNVLLSSLSRTDAGKVQQADHHDGLQANSSDELKKAAQDFEAMLLHQMLNQMTAGQKEGLFGESLANDFYYDMLYKEYGQMFAQRGGLGLQQFIVDQYSDVNDIS